MAWLERPVGDPAPRRRRVLLGGDDRGRQVPVVEERGVAGEALLAHQLLGVEAAVGLAELGVPFGGYLADAAVVGHRSSRVPPVRRPIIGRCCPAISASTRLVARVNAPAGGSAPHEPPTRPRSRPAARRCPTRWPRTCGTARPGTPRWWGRCCCRRPMWTVWRHCSPGRTR